MMVTVPMRKRGNPGPLSLLLSLAEADDEGRGFPSRKGDDRAEEWKVSTVHRAGKGRRGTMQKIIIPFVIDVLYFTGLGLYFLARRTEECISISQPQCKTGACIEDIQLCIKLNLSNFSGTYVKDELSVVACFSFQKALCLRDPPLFSSLSPSVFEPFQTVHYLPSSWWLHELTLLAPNFSVLNWKHLFLTYFGRSVFVETKPYESRHGVYTILQSSPRSQ